MNLSRTVSEINGDFNHPVYFAPQLKGFPLELATGAWCPETRMMCIGLRKKFDDAFCRLDTIHGRDGQTDTCRWQRSRYAERRAVNRDVKRGQKAEAKAKAEAKTPRSRSEPRR